MIAVMDVVVMMMISEEKFWVFDTVIRVDYCDESKLTALSR